MCMLLLNLATNCKYNNTVSNTSVQLVKANTNNIPLISELANIVWHQHYKGVVSDEQITYMLGKMYTHESLKKQMTEEAHDFYLINLNEKTIGFISVHEENTKGHYYLQKYYLLQDLAAKGNGTLAFFELLKLLKPKYIKLTVNRQNFKSINFYFKNGFKIESVADFDIGNGFFMNDFVMSWPLDGLGDHSKLK